MHNLIHPQTAAPLPPLDRLLPEPTPRSSPGHIPWRPDRCDLFTSVLQPSGASRLSPFDEDGKPRAQHVSAKSSTSLLLDAVSHRVLVAESTIESKAVLTFMADRLVVGIQDQPASIPFDNIKGEQSTHTFDYRVTTTDGQSIAVFAKPKERADRDETQQEVQAIADCLPEGFASEIRVVTEEDFPTWFLGNVVLLVSVKTDPWTHAHDAVRNSALALSEPVRIGDLTIAHGGGAVAFRPIVRLIHDGILELVEPCRIDSRCVVQRAAKGVA